MTLTLFTLSTMPRQYRQYELKLLITKLQTILDDTEGKKDIQDNIKKIADGGDQFHYRWNREILALFTTEQFTKAALSDLNNYFINTEWGCDPVYRRNEICKMISHCIQCTQPSNSSYSTADLEILCDDMASFIFIVRGEIKKSSESLLNTHMPDQIEGRLKNQFYNTYSLDCWTIVNRFLNERSASTDRFNVICAFLERIIPDHDKTELTTQLNTLTKQVNKLTERVNNIRVDPDDIQD
jgi:hypothetical protein